MRRALSITWTKHLIVGLTRELKGGRSIYMFDLTPTPYRLSTSALAEIGWTVKNLKGAKMQMDLQGGIVIVPRHASGMMADLLCKVLSRENPKVFDARDLHQMSSRALSTLTRKE